MSLFATRNIAGSGAVQRPGLRTIERRHSHARGVVNESELVEKQLVRSAPKLWQ